MHHLRAAHLRAVEGLTLGEIAKRMKTSLPTVKGWFKAKLVLEEVERLKERHKADEIEEAKATRETLAKPREEVRERAESDLFFLCKEVLGYTRLEEKIHRPLCDFLMDPMSNRKGVLFPRSWYKSTVGSIAYPIWRALRNPNTRALLVQNTIDNAAQKLASIRSHFDENEVVRDVWPHVLPNKQSRWTTQQLCLSRTARYPEPTFTAAGVRTRLTGRHYNLIIEDDTAAPELQDLGDEEMVPPTVEQVKQAIGFHKLCLPLLVDTSDEMLVVGTRWFELDLLKWIKDKEPQYRWMERAVREKDGKGDAAGDLVWPERFGDAVLEELKAAVGPYFYSALYMNDPVPTDQMVFKPEWVRYYEQGDMEKSVGMTADQAVWATFTTVDSANDPALTKGTPDYNVVLTCRRNMRTGEVYVIDYFRERCGPNKTVEAIMAHVRAYSPVKVGVESVGFQRMLALAFQERLRREGVAANLQMLHTNYASKEHRIQGLQPFFADGKVYIKRSHSAMMQELLTFPRGRNDDVIDALSMQMMLWGVSWGGVRVQERPMEDPLSFESMIAGVRARYEKANNQLPAMDLLRRRMRNW